MRTYSQATGELLHDGAFEGTGYSGHGQGRNNPQAEDLASIGPIPRGLYHIGRAYDDPHLGPCVMQLDPIGHNARGRSAFRIHGDSKNHDASQGCVILGPSIRHEIAASLDRELTVI